MSVNYCVSVGCYIEVKTKPRPITVTYQACANLNCPKCTVETKHRFCPDCGCGTGPHLKIKTCSPLFDLYEEFEDELDNITPEDNEMMLLMENKTNSDYRQSMDSGASFGRVDLHDLDIPGITNKFSAKYHKEIKRLKEVFGDNDVKIKFGAIGYWS